MPILFTVENQFDQISTILAKLKKIANKYKISTVNKKTLNHSELLGELT